MNQQGDPSGQPRQENTNHDFRKAPVGDYIDFEEVK